jgi:hypothetical protein
MQHDSGIVQSVEAESGSIPDDYFFDPRLLEGSAAPTSSLSTQGDSETPSSSPPSDWSTQNIPMVNLPDNTHWYTDKVLEQGILHYAASIDPTFGTRREGYYLKPYSTETSRADGPFIHHDNRPRLGWRQDYPAAVYEPMSYWNAINLV